MPTRRPDAVLLDVGGVFLLPSRSRVRSALARSGYMGIEDSSIDRAHYLATRVFPLDLENGADHQAHWDRYLESYTRALGVEQADVSAATEHVREEYVSGELWSEVIDRSRDGLAALVGTGVPVGIVSNSDGTVERRLRSHGICQVGPGPGVEVLCVIDSGAVGVEKPDPGIFGFALDVLGVAPDNVWYVGDTPAFDVIGARRAGIHPILMDPFDAHPDLAVERVRSVADVATLVE